MPELPEVETVKESLKEVLLGRKIVRVEVLREKSFPMLERREAIIDSEIVGLGRRAKFLEIELANGWRILTHLKMTGQLIYKGVGEGMGLAGGGHPSSDVLEQLPGRHTRIIYELDDGGQLFFNDMRVFGWMRVLSEEEVEAEYAKLGPDANTDAWQVVGLMAKCRGRRVPIKQVIMDNAVCCGLGNIYAAEALFAAGIDPRRPAGEVEQEELERLVVEAKRILDLAIAKRGTTFDGRYVDAYGQGGNFEAFLQVYGREGEKCRVCDGKIESVKLGGRASCFCPDCQK